ncbi:935_t:CDS:1, partial [Cetraspora pellucida]
YSGKKRQQYETSSDEEANTNLSGVINQMQDLRISTSYQKPVKYLNEEIKKSAITIDLDKNNIKEKKAKKSQESTSVFLYQMEREKALEQDQKNIELITEDKNEIPILLDTIEQSQWSPTN